MVSQLGRSEVMTAGMQVSSCTFDDLAQLVPQPYGHAHKEVEVDDSLCVSVHAAPKQGVLSFTPDGSYWTDCWK